MSGALVADRYRLEHRIGAGGMGFVWLAWDEVLRRNVAVKEVHLPAGLSDAEVAELHMRTLREARAAARLSHPNVVRTYDVLLTDDRPCIVMEHVPSRSLAEVIKVDGPLPPERAAHIGIALLSALKAAHDAGVLHRDIKPGNVLLGADGRVVLTDFGLAVFDDVGMHLTQTGVVHGSPQFIAPERAKDGTSTAASDLWSLGATLYAAVEGKSPYARSTSYATLAALATEAPDPPRRAGPLKPILSGLLRRDPAARISVEEATGRLQLLVTKGVSLPGTPIPRQLPHEDPGPADGAISEPAAAPPMTPSGLPIRNRRVFRDGAAGPRRPQPATSAPPAQKTPPAQPASLPVDTDQHLDRSWDLGYTGKGVRRGRHLRRTISSTVAAVAVVVVAVAAGYLVAAHPRSQSTASSASLPSDGRPPPPPPDGLRFPCTPTMNVPVSKTVGSPPIGANKSYALMDGWLWYTDPAEYQIEVPDRFQVARNADTACLYDTYSPRVLGVHRWNFTTKDPVTALKQQLAAMFARHAPPGYRLIKIEAVPLQSAQAEAEYTYDGPDGPQHAAIHEYIDGKNAAYTLSWDTRDFDWADAHDSYNLIATSFTPA